MKVEFELKKKKFTNSDGKEIEYFVLVRELIDGSQLELPIKGDKSKLLLMSLAVEKNKQ
ncbi:MAG: hypothetical protein II393_02150 [Cytophagales bacterium]|nr:hypothetical protein [Cytophagales bacterium]